MSAMSAPTLLHWLDAAIASCAARFWSELVHAYALAGQAAGGGPCFLPDPSGTGERAGGLGRCLTQESGRAPSLDLHAAATPRTMVDSGYFKNFSVECDADDNASQH